MTSYMDVLTHPTDRTTGIYWDKIESISEGFPQILDTVKNVLNADKKELMKVKGIGKKIAEELITITTQDFK